MSKITFSPEKVCEIIKSEAVRLSLFEPSGDEPTPLVAGVLLNSGKFAGIFVGTREDNDTIVPPIEINPEPKTVGDMTIPPATVADAQSLVKMLDERAKSVSVYIEESTKELKVLSAKLEQLREFYITAATDIDKVPKKLETVGAANQEKK